MSDYAIEAMWLLAVFVTQGTASLNCALAVEAVLPLTYFVWCWILM